MQSEHTGYGYGMTISACLWLGLFPLMQGGTYSHITYDKWVIMLILTGVTFFCFSADLIRKLILRKKFSFSEVVPDKSKESFSFFTLLPFILASALLLWTLLSCLFSDFGINTWWRGESGRYEGLASQICYYVIFVLFFFSRVRLKPVLLSAAAGVTVFLVIVLLQRAGANPLGLYPAGRSYERNPEFQGTIGNIDMGTGYLLLLSGLFFSGMINPVQDSLRSFRTGRKSLPLTSVLFPVVSLASFFISVYLIVTMEVQFGIISLTALFLAVLFHFLPRKRRLPLLILLIVVALLVVWFWPGESGGLWELHEIIHGRGRLSFGSNRIAVWVYSLQLARENLLFGGGSGTFQSRFNRFLSENNLEIPKKQDKQPLPDYFDNPHNEYIAQLTDHGLPAMLLFMALLLFAVFHRWKSGLPRLAPCTAAVLCYTVQAFFSFSVCLVAPMFWVILALSFREPL